MPTSISLVFANFGFCHRFDDVRFCCVFQNSLHVMFRARRLAELGAQSGNEIQFVFSETDVRQSDADESRRLLFGKLIVPSYLRLLLNIIQISSLAFSTFCNSTA